MLTATFEQVITLVGWVNTGSGLMVIINVLALPTQLAVAGLVGVTVIVIVCEVLLLFTNFKPLIFPEPFDTLAVKSAINVVGAVIAQV